MSKSPDSHANIHHTHSDSPTNIDERLQERIRQRAYQLYEARGATPGHELEDWTKAESEMLGPISVNRAA